MNSNIFYLLVFVACLSSAYCASLKFGDKAFLYKKTFGCNETNTECNKPANPKQDEVGELMVTLKNSCELSVGIPKLISVISSYSGDWRGRPSSSLHKNIC